MAKKIRILFLSANPWTTSRIRVDEEAHEIFAKLQEGSLRDKFELQQHAAVKVIDLQRLMMMYKPHIVHFSVHGSKREKLILGGTRGRGMEVDQTGLTELFALYRKHVRLVFLNACFTRPQAQSLCQVIDYSVGTGQMIGDKGGVAFAGAFYRALGFGKSVREAFRSAKAELAVARIPRTKGLELFVRDGLRRDDSFPKTLIRGKRRPSKPRANTRTSRGVVGGYIPARRRSNVAPRDSILSRTGTCARAALRAGLADTKRLHESRFEHVRLERTEALVSHRCASASVHQRPQTALKRVIAGAGECSRGQRSKQLSRRYSQHAPLPKNVRLLRVVITERFELVVNDVLNE